MAFSIVDKQNNKSTVTNTDESPVLSVNLPDVLWPAISTNKLIVIKQFGRSISHFELKTVHSELKAPLGARTSVEIVMIKSVNFILESLRILRKGNCCFPHMRTKSVNT